MNTLISVCIGIKSKHSYSSNRDYCSKTCSFLTKTNFELNNYKCRLFDAQLLNEEKEFIRRCDKCRNSRHIYKPKID